MTDAGALLSEWRRPIPPRELWLLVVVLLAGFGLFLGSRSAAKQMELAGFALFSATVALWLAGYVLMVLVHELGHALVGWATRMHVVRWSAGLVQAQRMRQGWRFRVAYPGRHPDASVGVVPRAGNTAPRPYLLAVIGGPAANVVVAALAAAWAVSFEGTAGAAWAWGLAWLSVLWGAVAAFLPSSLDDLPSDGDLIRMELSPTPGHLMSVRVGRWLGAMVEGRRAADAPAEELEAIRALDPVGGPLFVASAQLEVALEAGDWAAAVAVADGVEALLSPVPEREAIPARIPMFLVECAMARTLTTREPAPLEDAMAALSFAVIAEAGWTVPWIYPRAAAVLAFLRGDAEAARAALAASARHADDTVYASVRVTEASVRAHIERWAASEAA